MVGLSNIFRVFLFCTKKSLMIFIFSLLIIITYFSIWDKIMVVYYFRCKYICIMIILQYMKQQASSQYQYHLINPIIVSLNYIILLSTCILPLLWEERKKPLHSTGSNDRGNTMFVKRLETFVLSTIYKLNINIIIIIN